MESIRIEGFIDAQHNLSASVPGSVPPGPVTVLIVPSKPVNDDVDNSWAEGVAREWADDLADTRQDIYTLADGEAFDPS